MILSVTLALCVPATAQPPQEKGPGPEAAKTPPARKVITEQLRQYTPPADVAANRETLRRLAALEQKLDQLLREVQQLRQEVQKQPDRPQRDAERRPVRGDADGAPRAERDRDQPRRSPEADAPPRAEREGDQPRRSPEAEAPPRAEREGDRPRRSPEAERDAARRPMRGEADAPRRVEREGDQPRRSPEAEREVDVPKVLLQYASGLLQKYDKDQNGVLSKEEWQSLKGVDYAAADRDQDGQITRDELAAFLHKTR